MNMDVTSKPVIADLNRTVETLEDMNSDETKVEAEQLMELLGITKAEAEIIIEQTDGNPEEILALLDFDGDGDYDEDDLKIFEAQLTELTYNIIDNTFNMLAENYQDGEDVSVESIMGDMADELGLEGERREEFMENEFLIALLSETLGTDPEDPSEEAEWDPEMREEMSDTLADSVENALLAETRARLESLEALNELFSDMTDQHRDGAGIYENGKPVV